MGITIKKGSVQSATAATVRPVAEPGVTMVDTPAPDASGSDVAAAVADAGAPVAPRPMSRAAKTTSLIFGILGILAVLVFAAVLVLQAMEFSWFSQSPSLWPVK